MMHRGTYDHNQKLGTRMADQMLKEVCSVSKVSCERIWRHLYIA